MKFVLFLILVIFYKSPVFAEGADADLVFDFARASQAAKQFGKFTGYPTEPPKCTSLTSAQGDSVMSCTVPDSTIDENLIVKLPEYGEGQIPSPLKNILPIQFIKDVANKKVTCVFNFRTVNDNQQIIGCKGSRGQGSGKSIIGPEKCGDDWGYTHGLDVGLSCTSADGLAQTFTYSSDLFTDPDRSTRWYDSSGNSHMDQKFISENIFSFIQDNVNEGKVSYWRRGIGFVNMSSKKKWGLLQSTGQQEWFHDLRNRSKPGDAIDYNYVEGNTDKWGAFVTLATGLQAKKELSSSCRITASGEIGARLSSLKDSNLIYGSINSRFGVAVGSGQIYARAEYDYKRRMDSGVGKSTLAVGYETFKGTKFEVGATSQKGNRKDVPDLPNAYSRYSGRTKNDRLIFVQMSVAF